MNEIAEIQQALASLRQNSQRFDADVLATILAILEQRLQTTREERADDTAADLTTHGDRRLVTVLFAEVIGYESEATANRPADEMRGLWRRLDQIIITHGGTIDKHMGDIMMAVFGVPVATENDAERAVRAALAARQLVDVTRTANEAFSELAIRTGINTGPVSVGTVGRDGATTVIGDAVNVASRLCESAAPGHIILGESTFRLVEPFYVVEPLGQQPIKGRQMSVDVYRVEAARPRLFFTSGRGIEGVTVPLIGRDQELSTLQSAIEVAAKQEQGQMILVVGEAGVGKTRLASELNDWLQRDGPEVVVFQGRSDQRLQRMPFSLLRDLLTSYFGILDSDAPDVAEARLLETLQGLRRARDNQFTWPRLFRDRVRAVARLVGLNLMPAAEAAPNSSMRSAVDRAQDDILEFFELVTANGRTAVVFLEDIHWADRDSLELLEKLGRLAEQSSLVVIALARPQLFERRPNWLPTGPAPISTLELRPLPRQASYELASELLHYLSNVPDDLVEMIVRAAGGNPFYMEELVKVLLGDGVIVNEGEQWRLSVTKLDRLRVPDTLTGILQARLDRLPGIERITLQQAAVVGDEFWDDSVQQINQSARGPVPPEAVARALRSLEEREMISRVPLSAFAGAQAYQFRHSALREVAYETILLRDRPYYHVAAAEWMAAQSGDRAADYAAPIAEHYELAGDRERAAAQYEVAGRRAMDRQRPGRAAEYYSRALALLQQFPHHIDRRLSLLRVLGPALLAKKQTAEAVVAYQSMERSAEEVGDLLEQARAALALAEIYREQGQLEQMLAAAERAAQTAALTGAIVELQRAEMAQLAALRGLGREEEAQAVERVAGLG